MLEPSFPERPEVMINSEHIRYTRADGASSDAHLVSVASSEEFAGVVFIGRETLGRVDLLDAAKQLGVAIIATEAHNPVDALDYLRRNEREMRKRVRPGAALLIQSDSI